MKKLIKVSLTALFLCCFIILPMTAHAVPYGFYNITNNTNVSGANFSVDVTDATSDGIAKVSFKFYNNSGIEGSFINDVYFDDGTLLGIAQVNNGDGVVFSSPANNDNLPGGEDVNPPFMTTEGFSADRDGGAANGVNPGEFVEIIFNLQGGKTFNDTLIALNQATGVGGLRIGIHVQGLPPQNEKSDSYVNRVPEPGTLLLLGTGLMGLAIATRRRFRKQ